MKRLISLAISLIILCIIYFKIDTRELLEVFRTCNPTWMAISLAMVVPLTTFTAWRLQQLVPHGVRLGFGESNRLILAASVLNMVLPSKMGDLAKAYFMKQRGHLDGSLAFSLVVFEKTCDLLSLLLWCAFGLTVYPDKNWLFWLLAASVAGGLIVGLLLLGSRSLAQIFFRALKRFAPKSMREKLDSLQIAWNEMHAYFWQDKRQLTKIAATSVFIWFLHLMQIWMFTLALNAAVPFLANLALAPLAILAGLLPLTFAGVGTRDAAIIAFYHPYLTAPVAAALGLLCTSRYLMPAIAGLPFLNQYLALVATRRK
ncbi:hypothetical protein KR51_00028030 [Rubidibacter lacunae KORDI 51-2]|uniref:Integral membrane protein n=1 Tax=Rubidibacter lacunae KORDI 51-2 TaxID=582515 RepID=U5DIQ4_9CHRO|nr:lysylphosphatidylglycerol synthase transmembrane domain-containing protein [Rubidibacter lacunae]ERN40812.1 hypothetical protein KR51_00028030 [Rubidibacter lacunae KORDI 51-2]